MVPPDEYGEWVEVVGNVGIEKVLQEENGWHFNQAKATPFLQQPLLDLVGKLGVRKAAEEILNGMFVVPEGVDEWAACLNPFLARVSEDPCGRVQWPERCESQVSC